MDKVIHDVLLTTLDTRESAGGDVWHGMKRTDRGYVGFGEAYFSTINPRAVKPWKRHLRMTLNLIVPVGQIRFVLFDGREESPTSGSFQSVRLSREHNYQRLTVPPKIWVAFQGMGEPVNILLNIADLEHDPHEVERLELDAFPFDWNSAA